MGVDRVGVPVELDVLPGEKIDIGVLGRKRRAGAAGRADHNQVDRKDIDFAVGRRHGDCAVGVGIHLRGHVRVAIGRQNDLADEVG